MTEPDLKSRIDTVLKTEVAPVLKLDGAGIEVLDVTDGIVRVRLTGVCAGCPGIVMSLVLGLEQELKLRVPEFDYLEAVP